MLNKLKYIVPVVLFVLLIANIIVFVNSIKLSDDINRFENETKSLHQENLVLENKLYDVNSLQYAASLAANLDFTKTAEPIYLDNLKYAFNR